MQKKKQNNSVGNFIEVKNDVLQLPSFTEVKRTTSKKGVKVVMRGHDNLFPLRLAKLSKESSTLKSVVNSFAGYVSYGEIETENEDLQNKLTKDFNTQYDWYEFVKRVSKDRKTFGYGFIREMKLANEVQCFHVDASQVRFVDYVGDKPSEVAICQDWNDTKKEVEVISLYPNYSSAKVIILDKEVEAQQRIIPIMEYESGSQDYPFPIWSGAFYDAQVESLIGQYNANQFENGVTLSSLLLFDFGDVLDEKDLEAKRLKLEAKIKGTSNGRSAKSMIIPKTGDVAPPEYTIYPIDKEGSYLELQKLVENNIVKACNWFRSLAGLESAGTLGNNQQLRNEWELAERMIRNEQYLIYEAWVKAYPEFKDVDVTFNNASPLNAINEVGIIADLLKNKVTIGLAATEAILVLMGISKDQAKIMVYDSDKNGN